jgi:hypothetical protein
MAIPSSDYDTASEPLLLAIKSRHAELTALLEQVSSHWHGEDKFYRFYHQSWKLFGLQTDTLDIVAALQALWPERYFHSWFAQIIREGTGLEFSFADNRDWLRKGRPILEAFFHARTMLEFAVKYGMELDHAPRAMPSGWAALLQLFSGPEPDAGPVPPQKIVPAREEPFRL